MRNLRARCSYVEANRSCFRLFALDTRSEFTTEQRISEAENGSSKRFGASRLNDRDQIAKAKVPSMYSAIFIIS